MTLQMKLSDPEAGDKLTAFAPTPPTNIAISEEPGAIRPADCPDASTPGKQVSHLSDGGRAGNCYLVDVPV